MKQPRRSARALLVAITLLASLLAPTGIASAASDYDETYRVTDAVSLSNTASGSRGICTPVYYSTNLLALFDKASNPYGSQQTVISNLRTSYVVALGQGRRGVSQFEDLVGGYVGINVYWTEDTSLALIWEGNEGSRRIRPTGNDLKAISFVTQAVWWDNSNCEPYARFALSSYDPYVSYEDGSRSNFFVSTDFPNYPVGYEGKQISVAPPAARYVGAGDSYSGGEGLPPFEGGTDENGINQCHRSSLAYPRLLQTSSNLGPTAFVACGGATTADILDGQWNEPAQIEALTESTEKVSLTVGGNDAAFTSYLLGCVVACGPGTPIYDAMIAGIEQPAFKFLLEYTYERILQEAPNAHLYVADYPYLSAPSVTTCWGLDFSGAYEVQTALNEAIHSAIESVAKGNPRIHYVPTNYSGSPFAGGELCGGTGTVLFNGLMVPGEYSLHLNGMGQQAYAVVFGEAMN